MAYPAYSRAERIADGTVHVLGVSTALGAVFALFTLGAERMTAAHLYTATLIYAAALIIMLSASAAYHILADTAARPVLRRLDHAAIYVKIAGTATPLCVLLDTAFGYLMLTAMWVLALFGAAAKLRARRGRMTTGWLPYVALGWIGVLLFIPLMAVLPAKSLWMILAGGLIYTSGVVFYAWEGLRFGNAIWHLFVLVATACFFLGISESIAAPL